MKALTIDSLVNDRFVRGHNVTTQGQNWNFGTSISISEWTLRSSWTKRKSNHNYWLCALGNLDVKKTEWALPKKTMARSSALVENLT